MQYKYDLFLSYSGSDREAVTRLDRHLVNQGYSVWIDEWKVRVGESVSERITDGLRRSRYFAIWLTDSSIKSRWVSLEWQSILHNQMENNSRTILPMLGEKCEIPLLLRDLKYADFTESFDKGLEDLLGRISYDNSKVIRECMESLIEGIEPANSAKRLGRIALRTEDEFVLYNLWEAAQETKKPYTVIDHIVYYFSEVLSQTKNEKTKEIGFEILKKSAAHRTEVIVDKFAYAAADIALASEDPIYKKKIVKFIDKLRSGANSLAKEKYEIESRRMLEIEEDIFA